MTTEEPTSCNACFGPLRGHELFCSRCGTKVGEHAPPSATNDTLALNDVRLSPRASHKPVRPVRHPVLRVTLGVVLGAAAILAVGAIAVARSTSQPPNPAAPVAASEPVARRTVAPADCSEVQIRAVEAFAALDETMANEAGIYARAHAERCPEDVAALMAATSPEGAVAPALGMAMFPMLVSMDDEHIATAVAWDGVVTTGEVRQILTASTCSQRTVLYLEHVQAGVSDKRGVRLLYATLVGHFTRDCADEAAALYALGQS